MSNKTLLREKNSQVFLGNKKLELTEEEGLFLKTLIKNKNRTVDFDQIADCLWAGQAEKKFSLYAITKLAQRTRKKIARAGICPEIIQAKKGKGYLLV